MRRNVRVITTGCAILLLAPPSSALAQTTRVTFSVSTSTDLGATDPVRGRLVCARHPRSGVRGNHAADGIPAGGRPPGPRLVESHTGVDQRRDARRQFSARAARRPRGPAWRVGLSHQALQKAVRARDDFLSIAGHDLRNPLNALQLQLIGLMRAAQRRSEFVPRDWICERVQQAADDVDRLVRLVHNLLDVSRIAAGRLDLEPEDVDLRAVVATVAERLRPQLTAGQLTSDLVEAIGRWDRLRLEQIVMNLLSNAIKYGAGRPIEVRLDADAGRAYLSVTDHGIGIDPDRQNNLFERFERAVSRREYGGFGLGLWITRNTSTRWAAPLPWRAV